MWSFAELQSGRGHRRRLIAALAALGAAGALSAVVVSGQQAPRPTATVERWVQAPPVSMVLVFVSGAVLHPGLYRVSASARVADAVAAAGGVTALADPGHMPNLSALVHDGRQINVPLSRGTGTAAKLDINSASLDELAALPGMPAGLPEQIVQFRQAWGGFGTLTQLHDDLGVDSETVAGLRPFLRLDPLPSP